MAVRVIEVKKKTDLAEQLKKIRTAAYCRVSTELEQQQSSFELQVQYYTDYIKRQDGLKLVDIYADEGITGTSAKIRPEFQRMIKDCMLGKIEYIITKSISRFARNTMECLEYVRKLKEKRIGVFFEKENINTLHDTSEVILSILAAVAQDESRSISDNTKWGIRKRYQEGILRMTDQCIYGFRKDEDSCKLIPIPEEAKIVERIFKLYKEGMGYGTIAKLLSDEGISPPKGSKDWYSNRIERIIQNEKYRGDIHLQKMLTIDFLTHTKVKNDHSEIPSYYVSDHHEQIVSNDLYDWVQEERNRRADITVRTNRFAFSKKIICPLCGSFMNRHKQRSGLCYWVCQKALHSKGCEYHSVHEKILEHVVMKTYNQVKHDDLISCPDEVLQVKKEHPLMIDFDRSLFEEVFSKICFLNWNEVEIHWKCGFISTQMLRDEVCE